MKDKLRRGLLLLAAALLFLGTAGKAEERVIALSRSNAELWILAGGRLTATSDDAMDIQGLNPDAVSLGNMDHVSLESVAALEPDLLILFSDEPAQRALGEAARGIGIPVLGLDINGFRDYADTMKDLTGRTGREDLYEQNVLRVEEEIQAEITRAGSRFAGKSYLLLHVSATKSKAEKNNYFTCEMLNNLGMVNIAGDEALWNELSMEAIAAADPDYILVVPRGDDRKALEGFREKFTAGTVWPALKAVRENRFHVLAKELFGLKPNARWAEAYRQLTQILEESEAGGAE
ncbi:MAG: ABC transporter substrate-binding protein [Clostridia bacterium]|nr:ABC transporter substrate-binding protein [Clostridia bacterium]